MRELWMLSCLLLLLATTARAQLDVDALNTAYKAFDAGRRDGKGYSESPDSGSLGWGEGGIIASYAKMWEVTGDKYWLGKIRDHFRAIMATATDPDGDGFLSWQTSTYSGAVAYAERLHNISDARIEPATQKNTNGKEAAKCSGHTYVIEFRDVATAFNIVDLDTGEGIAYLVPFEAGKPFAQIEPFALSIAGEPKQGDRFLVRTYAPEGLEYTVHQGMFIYPVALFIEAVKKDPALQAEFGPDAETFLQFINKHVFEKNEQDWLDMGETDGAYRFQPRITDRFPNRIMPHNQYGALARAWLVLKDVQGAHPLMGQRAEQMVRYFHSFLIHDEEKDAYNWSYWDWIEYGEPGRAFWEDTSHGTIDISLAVEAARRGVIFTDTDMQRLANTWLKVMWNQDTTAPMMASGVDGREPYKFSPLIGDWTELSQWDRQVYDLALQVYMGHDEQNRTSWAPVMLLCAKRAGVQFVPANP